MLFIITASALWATDSIIRYPLMGQGVSADTIVFCEHLLLMAIFLPFMLKKRQKIWSARVSEIFYFVVVGGLGSAVATLAFTRAFFMLNPSLVILLQKLQPLVAILLARVVLHEPIRKNFLALAGVCLLGGVLISHKDIFPGLGNYDFTLAFGKRDLVGYGLTLLAIIGWGSATVFGKKLGIVGYNEKEIMAGRFSFGFLFLLPMLAMGQVNLTQPGIIWGKIVIMVLLSGLAAMFLYYRGLKMVSARLATIAEMFFPLFAILLNWVVLGAKLDAIQIMGAVLLMAASGVIQAKKY